MTPAANFFAATAHGVGGYGWAGERKYLKGSLDQAYSRLACALLCLWTDSPVPHFKDRIPVRKGR